MVRVRTQPGMRHLNGHLLCAIDTETTGLKAGYHDIWQVAIVPLGADIRPIKSVMPFCMDIRIKFPDRIEKNAIKIRNAEFATRQEHAIEPYTCADLFDTWFDRLKLPMYKKIVPLAQNWLFDRGFLIEWLGETSFDHSFYHIFRDTMIAAAFDSDLCDFKSDPILFMQYSLGTLCKRLDVTNHKPHDALQDALATAEVYRRMLLRR